MIPTEHQSALRSVDLPPLPAADATIEDLAPDAREALAGFWQRRSELELTTTGIFAEVARNLFNSGASPDLLWLACRAQTDELKHSAICQHVASVYRQGPAIEPIRERLDPPQFGDAPLEVNRVLYIVLQCCLNETIASTHLRATLKAARSPLIREATRLMLADEIDHARLGWAHLTSPLVTRELRLHVGCALPALLRIIEKLWLGNGASTAIKVPEGHGYLPAEESQAVTQDALDSLVFPGLRHAGIDTSLGERFIRRQQTDDA